MHQSILNAKCDPHPTNTALPLPPPPPSPRSVRAGKEEGRMIDRILIYPYVALFFLPSYNKIITKLMNEAEYLVKN